MAAKESDEQGHKVPLRVLVDKEKNKVVFAEAGKDFVDVLLSFLTLPLGTIARLVAKESNMQPVRVGSLSSLYESVADHGEESLWTQICKEMLLHPRNSMGAYCQQLKLNIDDTPLPYFCSQRPSSTPGNQKGKVMDSSPSLDPEKGFVKETATFIISDDLYVMPNALGTSVHLLQKLGVDDIGAIDKQTINITKKEVVDLLKLSLFSKTPLTDFILKKEKFVANLNPRNRFQCWIGDVPSDEGRKMSVKVLIRKSDRKILLAEAKEDFADFLFSFLTFPLGGVLHMLEGSSSLSCVDNLYKSMTELCPDRYLMSQGLKDKLAKPLIAPKFELKNQILPIGASCLRPCQCHKNIHLNFVDAKSPVSGGFAKGPLMYMVTDDLVVTPMSSTSGVLYLDRMKVPLNDLEERIFSIGLKEGLSILKASLISTSALTNGLNQSVVSEQFFRQHL